jgi:hypothetical protein
MVHESARHGHTLLLTARKLLRVVVKLGGEAHEPQDVGHLAPDVLPALADHLERVRHVVVHRSIGQQLVVLEDHTDVATQVGNPVARHLPQRRTGDQHLARGGLELLHQQPDARGFTATGWPNQEDELPATDAERCAVETDHAAVVDLRHLAQLHHRCAGGLGRLGSTSCRVSRMGRRHGSPVDSGSVPVGGAVQGKLQGSSRGPWVRVQAERIRQREKRSPPPS